MEVHVLYDGYATVDALRGEMNANCTCTLVKSEGLNVIVDTMTPWDGGKILSALDKHSLTPERIGYVVSTHGHSDHTGNNNLFLSATHVVGACVSRGCVYYYNLLADGSDYRICDRVYVTPTPGHTLSDVTVVVDSDNMGKCAIAGDLFEREEDIDDPNVWIDAGSESPEKQRQHRYRIAAIADWIIPGHGPAFKVSSGHRLTLHNQINAD